MRYPALALAVLTFAATPFVARVDAAPTQEDDAGDGKRSAFGVYEGYSEARFDGWTTTSQYVEMRDGVLIAVDITRPTLGGVVSDEPLPLVWTHSRYHRRMFGTAMADAFPDLQRLLTHGYVVAAAGVRGSGASTGVYEGLFSEAETSDAIELIEWFAEQPFCDGNIGMYGGSYLGITQYMAASRAPEALKAIFPDVAALDMYDLVHPGGVYRADIIRHWGGLTAALDTSMASAPVDDDPSGELRDAAMAEHEKNWDVEKEYAAGRRRDYGAATLDWLEHGPVGVFDELLEARVPTYHSNGWYDVFALDTTLHFANNPGPQRMIMGDWSHAQLTPERMQKTLVEKHRWFDHFLKGVDNGVLEGPRVHYALMVEPGESVWEAAETWPPQGLEQRVLYFAPGPTGSVASKNDGALGPERPVARASDRYPIDAGTTTGSATRWDNAVGAAAAMDYSGLAQNDTRCLTYTTPPLEDDLIVIGHPVVTLWITATRGEAALHVLLEEVGPEGDVRYVTEGVLAASQRRLAEPPYDNLGLPYQRCFAEDAQPVPADEPVEVRMDLHPTATVFNVGHRLRVSVMGADADNTEPLAVEDNELTIFHGADTPSSIALTVRPE